MAANSHFQLSSPALFWLILYHAFFFLKKIFQSEMPAVPTPPYLLIHRQHEDADYPCDIFKSRQIKILMNEASI